jgi:hypothetical protein
MTQLDARCEARLEEWLAAAPALSQLQQDIIAATFADSLPRRKAAHPADRRRR